MHVRNSMTKDDAVVIQRSLSGAQNRYFVVGRLRVDPATLTADGSASQPLGKPAVATLCLLCERVGSVVSKDELFAAAWPGRCVDDTSLWQTIYTLRRVLLDAGYPGALENARGRGYRLRGRLESAGGMRPAGRWTAALRRTAMAGVAALLAVFVAGSAGKAPANTWSDADARAFRLAQFYRSLPDDQGVFRSERLLKQLHARHSSDPSVLAALSDTELLISAIFADVPSGTRARRAAFAYAAAAVRADPHSADALAAYGSARTVEANRLGAGDAFLRESIAIDPANTNAHLWYGESLLLQHDIAGGTREIERAASLAPGSVEVNLWLWRAYFVARRPDVAARYVGLAQDAGVDPAEVWARLGLVDLQRGRYAAAAQTFARLNQCRPRMSAALQAQAYALAGRRQRARLALERALPAETGGLTLRRNIGFAFLSLGERRAAYRAFAAIETKDAEERALLAIDPRLDSVRRDPLFEAIVRT